MMRPTLEVIALLPEVLDAHADAANASVLKARAGWEGIDVHVRGVSAGDVLPRLAPDFVLVGSCADEDLVSTLTSLRPWEMRLADWVDSGVALLAVDAGWHLLSRMVESPRGSLVGLGVFSGSATVLPKRASRDLIVAVDGERVVGYENHSRGYRLGADESAWGAVLAGVGNSDGGEGAARGSAIGTHLHGPLLGRNPAIADRILNQAMLSKYDAEFRGVSQEARRADYLARRAGNRAQPA